MSLPPSHRAASFLMEIPHAIRVREFP